MRGQAVKERKRNEAKERQEKYDKLTIEQKIDKLDMMFGKGLGATKERAKLQKKLKEKEERKKEKTDEHTDGTGQTRNSDESKRVRKEKTPKPEEKGR